MPHALKLRVVRRDTRFQPSTLPTDAGIQEIYGALAADEERTEAIASDTLDLLDQGRSPIVLTERRNHLDRLAERLSGRVPALVVLHGEMRPAGRLHRAHPGKHEALVYDYVDTEVPVLRRMFAKRLKAYRTLGYEFADAA